MDYGDFNAPMYFDFEMMKEGVEQDVEGDEWFDKQNEGLSLSVQDDTPCTSQENIETNDIKEEMPKAKYSKEEEMKKMKKCLTMFKNHSKSKHLTTSEPDSKRQRRSAVKATESIHHMYKPKQGTSSFSAPKPSTSQGYTLPTTPEVLKRYQSQTTKNQGKTSEEIEMEKIKILKLEAQKRKQLSKQSLKKNKSKRSTPIGPIKTAKRTTEPVGFQFKTDDRFKPKLEGESVGNQGSSTFPMNLRSYHKTDFLPNDPSERKPPTPKEPTKVKPFKFLTDERIKLRHETNSTLAVQEKYVSRAEYIEKFEKTTPPRFRTKLQKEETENKNRATDITTARTPNLQSRLRSRPLNVVGFAEQEEKELEEIKRYKFKANPVNPDIFRPGGEFGLHQHTSLNPQSVTKALSPHLATKERFGTKRSRDETEEKEEPKKEFKALPMPRTIFEKITGVPEKRPQELTTPHSPAIVKKRKLDVTTIEVEKPTVGIKPLPMPRFTSVFEPVLTHTHTEMKPFSFVNKYASKDEVIDELMKKDVEMAAKKREFHANPLPDLINPPNLPQKLPTVATKIEPFKLQTDERVQHHLEKFNEQVAKENEEARKIAEFQATENKAIYNKAFVPVKINKPLTDSVNLTLHTELRKEQRDKFELGKQMKDMEREMEEAKKRALREVEEAKELKLLRRSIVHKAQPIQNYSSIEIQPSSKPLTRPLSPVFTSTSRLRTQL